MNGRRLNPSFVTGLIVLAVATILQEGVVSYTTIGSVRADLVLLVVLNWSLLRGIEEGMIWGLVGGVFVDLFSGLPFGTSSLAYAVGAALVTVSERAFSRAHISLPLLTAFFGTLVYYAIAFIAAASADHQFFLSPFLVAIAIGSGIVNGLLSPFIYWGIQALELRLRPRAQTTL